MFKTTPIIVMAALCLNFNSRAQSQQTLSLPEKQAILGQTNEIIIEGKIDSSIINKFNIKELLIKIHDPVKALTNDQEFVKVSLNSDRTFKARIQSSTKLIHLSFWTMNDERQSITRIHFPARNNNPEMDETYLFETGDSVFLSIYKGGILSFKGKGADKLNCQFQIYNLMEAPLSSMNSVYFKLKNERRINEALKFQDDMLELYKKMGLTILDSYKTSITEDVYPVLYLNVIAQYESKMLRNLNVSARGGNIKDMERSVLAIQQYHKNYLLKQALHSEESAYVESSPLYIQLLFEKEWNAYRLFSKNRYTGDAFLPVYESIKARYQGKIRDLLLLRCFKVLSKWFSSEMQLSIDDGVATIDDPLFKNAMIVWNQKLRSAFPFELQDVDGKIHRLNDYKGKLLVIDFWFTGCGTCVVLNKAMEPIVEKYSSNKDVVFLTISEDVNKDIWKKSIEGGKYTSLKSINLYTNGLGGQHPILKYYNFIGAPWQLIIGKNGELITSSPPQVVLGKEKVSAFMKIIDDNLNVQ